ncbi:MULTISPECIES: DUF4892 domain-containing protein [Halopseudomonas]|jgi:hypothetical protein|uniref:DUF4892 domain-containing protein n=1 Tax=Halopseudomonas formosensis TaxID=1002526 RepID=A0ABU5BVH4_9GAMM|nr:DUF4892 domain-containing protein [Halopseudomonas formosensis]MDX9686666.1 DUF4892 domain-containing protein [Halopseudomonas formosensis]MDY3196899.1 DUF4892 domain-containing protein [Pseudomonadaceae bacterium]NLC00402.1 DUF4892 domain-containing protein [Halopseudomonas formosensis]
MHLSNRNRRWWRRSLVTGALLAVAATGAGAAEGLAIEPFPRAEVARERVQQASEHRVVIGNIRRINNQVRAERELQVVGELIRVSWRIPAGHSAREALGYAVEQLQQHPHTTLFFCEGRECGSSSLWANQVLDYSRLYGPEDNQLYLALRLDDQPQRFISLYAITRGNQQVYLHMDQLTPEQPVTEVLYPTAATLGKILNAENELLLPDASVGDDEQAAAWLDLVTRMLRSDIRLRVQVDGARAPEFVEGLVERGISSQRLDIGKPEPAGSIRLEKR